MRKLEPYQETAITFLSEREHAFLIAGMGLGKTAATLFAIAARQVMGGKAALIVAPLRVAAMTWPAEVEEWPELRGMRVVNLRDDPHGLSKPADIYLLNWERLDRLPDMVRAAKRCPFDLVVFDEVSKAKAPKSKRVESILPLLAHFKIARWGLTGTPRPNSHRDLWGQARLLNPEWPFAKSYPHWEALHFYAPNPYDPYKVEPRPGAIEQIEASIAPMTLTLLSSDHLKIPDTSFGTVEVTLPPDAREAYRRMEKEMVAWVRDREVTAATAAVVVNKLLQIAGGFVYAPDEGDGTKKVTLPVHRAKLDALREYLAQARRDGETVLIAANYRHEIEAIKGLGAPEWSDALLAPWNAGKGPSCIVAHPASIGHGLNLQHGGRRVLWFSPTWSRELYDQFNARLARKGQREVTVVDHLVTLDTADETVLAVLADKGAGQSALMQSFKMLMGRK